MKNRNQKIIYIELLRTVAIFLVIFNHTRAYGYSLYSNTTEPYAYWGSLILSIFCKIAVPIFFMISGGLLLGKEESIKAVMQKRVLRYLLVILLFTFLQYLRIVRVHPENGFQLSTWLLYCYCGNIIEPYWFLKSYLSFLLVLPLLRLLANAMHREHFHLLIGLKLLTTLVSFIFIYTGYSMNLSFPLLTDILFYPLLGYYFMHSSEDNSTTDGKYLFRYGTLLAIVLGLTITLAHLYFRGTNTYVDDFHTITVWILASLFFLMCKHITIKRALPQKILLVCGSCSFGVYLIEDVVRNQVERLMPFLTQHFSALNACLIFVCLSMVAGTITIWLVKKIPFVNKLI